MLKCATCGVINSEYFECCGKLVCREHYPCRSCKQAEAQRMAARRQQWKEEEEAAKRKKEMKENILGLIGIGFFIILFYYALR